MRWQDSSSSGSELQIHLFKINAFHPTKGRYLILEARYCYFKSKEASALGLLSTFMCPFGIGT